MIANLEEIHARWLDEMVDFAQKYMVERHGNKPMRAAILEIPNDDFVFHCLGTFNIPAETDRLILHMARFCRCTFGKPDAIIGLDNIKELPEPTFCLNSLLIAGFPKNLSTDIFRNHDGGIGGGDIGDPKAAFRSAHIAFAGLGIILMNESRKILSPNFPSPNSQVLKMADGKFISFIPNLENNRI